MIFYASGALSGDDRTLDMLVLHNIDLLASFAYSGVLKTRLPLLAQRLRAARKKLWCMVDSGAFTAWSSGKDIDREALIDKCNQLQDEYSDCFNFVYVSLDRMPGRKGRAPTAQEIKDAAEESMRNYDVMRARVNGPVKPVFHYSDPLWLGDHYSKQTHYLGLGVPTTMPYEVRRRWVHQIAPRFSNHPLHGLGMTGTRMLRTVRWHSVDSASWVQIAGFGNIAWLLPNGALKIISVSRESPNNKRADAHLSTLSKMHQEEIIEGLKEYEIPLELILTTQQARAALNVIIFKRACDWAAKQSLTDERSLGVFDDA